MDFEITSIFSSCLQNMIWPVYTQMQTLQYFPCRYNIHWDLKNISFQWGPSDTGSIRLHSVCNYGAPTKFILFYWISCLVNNLLQEKVLNSQFEVRCYLRQNLSKTIKSGLFLVIFSLFSYFRTYSENKPKPNKTTKMNSIHQNNLTNSFWWPNIFWARVSIFQVQGKFVVPGCKSECVCC